jgi:Peptidase S80 family
MGQIKFTSTRLDGTGKKGLIQPDSNGYYTIPVGGLNVFNSVGQFYAADGARKLFEGSSTFMRRVKSGCLKGELGHPKRTPGMTSDDYLTRILSIEETNVVCHFSEIWLDEDFGRKNPKFNNPKLVAIMARLKPSGTHGASLAASLNNPEEEVCFSIRALTQDFYNKGVTHRVLEQIVTWDNVTEPGLALAKKTYSPMLECLTEHDVKGNQLEKLLTSMSSLAAMESTKELATEALSIARQSEGLKITTLPSFSKW